MRAEAEIPFEDTPLRIPAAEHETSSIGRLMLSLISGRATWRDAGCGDFEMVEVRIDPPVHGAAPFTLRRPYDTRSPYGAAAIAGSWFRAIEASILDADADRIREILDDAGDADAAAADYAYAERV